MKLEKIIRKLKNGCFIRGMRLIKEKGKKWKGYEIEKIICPIEYDQFNKLFNNRLLERADGIFIFQHENNNENFERTGYFCKICKSIVFMKSSLHLDYYWKCSNKKCINNICPENTFDINIPKWVFKTN